MGTDNRLDFPLDRIAKERDEIKAEDYYIRRGTTLPGIISLYSVIVSSGRNERR